MQELDRYQNRYARERYAQGYQQNEDPQAAVTLMGKLKNLAPALHKISRYIDRAFPNTADEIANKLTNLTPKVMIGSYVLLAMVIAASQFNLLWAERSLWGITCLPIAMAGVFMWIWSSSIMILPDLSGPARAGLKRAMRFQSSAFVAALLTIIYFAGMAVRWW